MHDKILMLFAVLIGLNVAPAAAGNAANAKLCVEYSGKFVWDEVDPQIQNMRVRFSNISYGTEGLITASGSAYYNIEGKLSTSQAKVKIDRNSHRFEMWEINSNDPNFVSDGSHLGRISRDFSTINATWTTNKTGDTGKLRLKALDSCYN